MTLASDKAFTDPEKYPVQGVGAGAWRSLWVSARNYAQNTAYPGSVFPIDEIIDRCVLCHQKLTDQAKLRFQEFEKFVKDETTEKYMGLVAELEILTRLLNELTAPSVKLDGLTTY